METGKPLNVLSPATYPTATRADIHRELGGWHKPKNLGIVAVSERLGWDIVGLISLMRREIEKMAQLDLRDPALREELGLSTVSVPSHHRSKQQKRRMGEAIELIGAYVEAHPGCTRLDIARGLDRAKSPHLIVQIEWLVTQKVILREHVIRENGAVEYRYRIAE